MREKDEGTKNETENNGVRRRVHDEGTRVGGGRTDERKNEVQD